LAPILNLDELDPSCPIAANESLDTSPGRSFLNVNVSPQGQASAVAVRRFDG
jgi:3-oxoacyl-[acyl-carrier-protein] synthase II